VTVSKLAKKPEVRVNNASKYYIESDDRVVKKQKKAVESVFTTNVNDDKTEDEGVEEIDHEKKRKILNGDVDVEVEHEQPVVQAIYIDAPVVNLEAEVEKLRSILAERDRLVEAQVKHLADKDKMMADKDKMMADKDKLIADKDKLIAEKTRQIEGLVSAFRGA
jgi:hypothetical protein